jgi:hypothetical protein
MCLWNSLLNDLYVSPVDSPAEGARPLDPNGLDRVHVMFSGTSLVGSINENS